MALDLAYVALVVDKPAASAAILGKGSGLLRRAFASNSSEIKMLSIDCLAPELSGPDHGPNARNGVCIGASAAAGPDHQIRGGQS